MAKRKDLVGGSAAKKHPKDFTRVAVALNNPKASERWLSSNLEAR